MQDVGAVVLDTVQLIIRVFDQLGGRRLVHTAVTGWYAAAQKSFNALLVCGRGEPPPGAGGIQQPGNEYDDSSVDRLQCYVAQSVRPEHSQGVHCRVRAQEPMTFCAWLATDSRLETVTPSISTEDTRAMPGSGGGGWTA